MSDKISSSHLTILDETPPAGQLERVHFLARALAYGALLNLWSPGLIVVREIDPYGIPREKWTTSGSGYTGDLPRYLSDRWDDRHPQAAFMEAFGYLSRQSDITAEQVHYLLTPRAFALLERPSGRTVFISYRRAESSAFALLLLDRLKHDGFDVFIDIQDVSPGEAWQERLQAEILHRDVFICLIGPSTLSSSVVHQELAWAASKQDGLLIPVWHNGFAGHLSGEPEQSVVIERNAVVVQAENVQAYNNAYEQLVQHLRTLR